MPSRAFLILFLLGAAVRFGGVLRPINLPNWRECDVASIARNFSREGMNILYPRIDWRGDGPGFVESEFPVYPWIAALLYHVFGVHEVILRSISFVISLISMLAFFGLARRLLPPPGALAASAFFIVSPLANLIGHSVQPEGLMYCAYWIAAYGFLRWLDDQSPAFFALAAVAAAAAILAKVTAAHIGLFFAFWLVSERGLKRAALSLSSWIFALIALTPAALWYAHSFTLWTRFGNSLGFSNEDHWARWDLFTNPRLLGGVLAIDLWFVWTIPGLLIAAYGLWADRRARAVRFAGLWLISVFVYYLVAARTLSALWASYYHAATIAPAALLFGHGVLMALRAFRGCSPAPDAPSPAPIAASADGNAAPNRAPTALSAAAGNEDSDRAPTDHRTASSAATTAGLGHARFDPSPASPFATTAGVAGTPDHAATDRTASQIATTAWGDAAPPVATTSAAATNDNLDSARTGHPTALSIVIPTAIVAAAWPLITDGIASLSPRFADRITGPPVPALLLIAMAALCAAAALVLTSRGAAFRPVAICIGPAFFCASALIASDLRTTTGQQRYLCAQHLAPHIPAATLIVASGGFRIGPTGRAAASDAPYMFYWLDRKGFSLANEDQSVARLDSFARRGARLFIAEKDAVATAPGFEPQLRTRYRILAECSTAWLFEIRP